MTTTAAIRQARSDVCMRRQGAGWVVGCWDARVRAVREDHECPYDVARERVRLSRILRALELLDMMDCPGGVWDVYNDPRTSAGRWDECVRDVTRDVYAQRGR